MAGLVLPKAYLIGHTTLDRAALQEYLHDTDQLEFNTDADDFEILTSFFAKLCYKSLVVGKNQNVKKIRDTFDNVIGTYASGHGSVFEHFTMNFVFTDVSRVFTHELVRHRVGTAFSQTSGRYVRSDEIDLIIPPALNPYRQLILDHLDATETLVKALTHALKLDTLRMEEKKKLTSAIRRIAPNGQSNEIGFSCNIRELRHVIHMRTSRHAEWEIRYVFDKVANIIMDRCPLMLHGFTQEHIDGIAEWSNGLGC